jgi:hypothetical protein
MQTMQSRIQKAYALAAESRTDDLTPTEFEESDLLVAHSDQDLTACC